MRVVLTGGGGGLGAQASSASPARAIAAAEMINLLKAFAPVSEANYEDPWRRTALMIDRAEPCNVFLHETDDHARRSAGQRL
jgi:hypothetical protein